MNANALCALHPEAASVTTCERCGSFACLRCQERPGLCRACGSRLHASVLSIGVGALGAASLCGCLPLGALAFALSFIELSRVRQGRSAPQSAAWATAGRVLSVVSFVLSAIAAWVWWGGH